MMSGHLTTSSFMNIAALTAPLRDLNLDRGERKALWLFLLFSVLLWIPPVVNTVRHHKGNKDYGTWEDVAHLVREGKAIYPEGKKKFDHNFFYPPPIAPLFYAPLSYAGQNGMVILLCAFTTAGHLISILISVHFATGRVRGQRPLLYWVAFLVSVPFVWDMYFLGQLNLTLLAVMLVAFLALDHLKRPLTAGALLAVSAAAKAFPLTSIGYLIWRRHWLAALSMIGSLVLILVIIPAPIRGFDRNLQELRTWTDNMLLHNTGDTLANQPDRGFKFGNQTLVSVVHRLTRPLNVGKERDGNLTVNFISISKEAAFVIFFIIAGSMCLAYVIAMPTKARRTARTNALEYAILLLLIVIFSPKAGSYYYVWSMPGFTIVAAEALRSPVGSKRRRWIWTGFFASIIVMASALTQNFDRTLQGMGATMWGGFLLFVTLVAILWNHKTKAPNLESA
jgi:hypothetical protein